MESFFGGLLKLETEFLLRYNENNAAMDLVGASGFWVHVLRLVWLAGMMGSSSFGASPCPRHLAAMPRVVWNPVLLSRCRRELFIASIRGREQRWNGPYLKFQKRVCSAKVLFNDAMCHVGKICRRFASSVG